MPRFPLKARPRPALLVGLIGVLSALALPFAPVIADQTTVSWPVKDAPAVSSTAVFAPYRPTELTVIVPCPALRPAGALTTVLATAGPGDGLMVVTGPDGARLLLGDRVEQLPLPADDAACRVTILAGPQGVSITQADGRVVTLAEERVPEVFGLRTELAPAQAAGLAVTATVDSPFNTSPSPLKLGLIAVQLISTATALTLLVRRRPRAGRFGTPRWRWRPVWFVDVGVVGILGLWAVIGPLAVDDGWASVIARNVAGTGNPGNYYRWWNASEVPFALSQQLLAPLTGISLAPLWLRLPSTVLAVATWFALSRGVLRAAVPALAATPRLRLPAALFLLLAWLPFNLGTRPESYVAFGATAVLWLLWRARTPAGLGWAALAMALTVPISPTAIIVGAPVLVFAPRIVAILRRSSRLDLAAQLILLACVGGVALTAMFADQTWAALATATDWHTFFGPSLPWYDEPDRYRYLLGDDQQGSAAKRAPILLALAMLPVVLLGGWRTRRDVVSSSAIRISAVLVLGLLLLALSPSKWSYHLGAMAGFVAAFLVVAVVLVVRRGDAKTAVAGGVLLAGAAAWAFAGPNAWWLPAVYDVPFADSALRPLGVTFTGVVLMVAVIAVVRRRAGRAWRSAPAAIAVAAAVAVLALLLGSFVVAPLRRPQGSLAVANLHRLTGGPVCGLADDIEVLPDGAPLTTIDQSVQLDGFTAQGGFLAGAPPPDPPGTGASAALWGSWSPGGAGTGILVSPWFALPALGERDGLAVSVSGRIDDGNSLAFQFGTSAGTLGGPVAPIDRVAPDEDPAHPLWRSVGIDAPQVPAGADRVRLRAVDGRTDPNGWLAVTGPRLRSVIPLAEFLAGHGPVLISWPISFLFPCVHNIPIVSGGLAQTPGSVITGPRPRFDEERDRSVGGTFAELGVFGELGEVPTRLVGHPEIDWGALFLSGDTAARDAYRLSITRVPRTGLDNAGHAAPEH